MRTGLLGPGLLSIALVGTALVGACGAKKGALILAINTDMKAPKDVNAVSVTVSTNGAIKHSFIGRVTPDGEVLLPATLAIVEPDDANASIRIRVMAFQERKPRVLRDIRTTVPRDGRTALLRIPLNFVNDGSTKSAPLPDGVLPPANGAPGGGGGAAGFDFMGSFQPDCADFESQTWIDGECKDNGVDANALPTYDDGLVFGAGKDGADSKGCFEVGSCFASAAPIPTGGGGGGGGGTGTGTPPPADDAGARKQTLDPRGLTVDTASCRIALGGADASQLNLALVTPDTGECVKPGECYLPIDQGLAGWRVENGSVQLPQVVCKLLSKGIRLFQTTGKCAAKTESQPICRPAPKKQDTGSLACLSTCGACVVQHCDTNAIAACFGPNWAKGMVSGRCKDLYECGCGCTDFNKCQCESRQFGSPPGDCEACLNQNINACADTSCRAECKMNKDSFPDGGIAMGGATVQLSFTPGAVIPLPAVGAGFSATMGQSSTPVPGDSAVSANSGDGVGGFLKIEWCSGTLSPGKTFTQFSRGPGCASGNPFVDFSVSVGGHWVTGTGAAGPQGSLVVQTLNPLTFSFQGLRLDADNNGKTTGSFTVTGTGSWTNATP